MSSILASSFHSQIHPEIKTSSAVYKSLPLIHRRDRCSGRVVKGLTSLGVNALAGTCEWMCEWNAKGDDWWPCQQQGLCRARRQPPKRSWNPPQGLTGIYFLPQSISKVPTHLSLFHVGTFWNRSCVGDGDKPFLWTIWVIMSICLTLSHRAWHLIFFVCVIFTAWKMECENFCFSSKGHIYFHARQTHSVMLVSALNAEYKFIRIKSGPTTTVFSGL